MASQQVPIENYQEAIKNYQEAELTQGEAAASLSEEQVALRPPYLPEESSEYPLPPDPADLFSAAPRSHYITEATANQMSETLLKHTCDFCKTKTFSNSHNLRRHYLTCRQIKILEQTAPHLVPQLIKDYKEAAQQRLEERRAHTKRKLEDGESTDTTAEEEFDPKAIRRALNELKTPLAYYPCPKCCLPLNSADKLTAHLIDVHQYISIEPEQQDE